MKSALAGLFALLPYFAAGQVQSRAAIDSLYALLAQPMADTARVNVYDYLSYAYAPINPDSGIYMGQQALKLSEKIDWPKGKAAAYADMGINYEAKAAHNEAMQHNRRALDIYQSINDRNSVAAVLQNMALIYQRQGSYSKALENKFKALKIFEQVGNREAAAITLENIGSLYFEQKDYEQTRKYYQQAIELNKQNNSRMALARNLGNMGILYAAEERYKQALAYHEAALKINRELGRQNSIQINLSNIGIIYGKLGQSAKGLQYQLEALKICEGLGLKTGIAVNAGNIGEAYYALAQDAAKTDRAAFRHYVGKAIAYLEQAVAACRSIEFYAPLTEFIPVLSEAYAVAGNHQKAYEYHKEYLAIKDSIFSLETKAQIANLENERQKEIQAKNLQLKDKQIQIARLQLKQKQHEQMLYLLVLALLVLVLVWSVRAAISYRRRNKKLADEKKQHQETIYMQTADIYRKNMILGEIAHLQSHDVRGHVATILGLSQLFNPQDAANPDNKAVLDGISESAKKLDMVIRQIVQMENELKQDNAANGNHPYH